MTWGVMTFIDRPAMSQVSKAMPSESISKRKFVRFIGLSSWRCFLPTRGRWRRYEGSLHYWPCEQSADASIYGKDARRIDSALPYSPMKTSGLFLIFSYPDLITLPQDRNLASEDAQKSVDCQFRCCVRESLVLPFEIIETHNSVTLEQEKREYGVFKHFNRAVTSIDINKIKCVDP